MALRYGLGAGGGIPWPGRQGRRTREWAVEPTTAHQAAALNRSATPAMEVVDLIGVCPRVCLFSEQKGVNIFWI